MDINKGSLKKILGRIPNWKSPGPDLAQGFQLKSFSSLYGRVISQLKECLESGFVPSWLTKGRTALLQKNKSKGNIVSNYRPIIIDQIYGHLDQKKLLPEEQKGCRKRSRGTNDLFCIDRAIIKKGKSRKIIQQWYG